MIDTDKYMYEEEAKKIVQDAGLINECDGFLDVHYKSIAHLLTENKRLREQFKLAYDWVDTQFPDGGMADFAEYIGDEEE